MQPLGPYADVDAMVPDCRACQRCKLGATRTHAAVYRGNPLAPLMLIGEGPGQQEDMQGSPFVGPAGQLLDKILASVGLDPTTDVFITNVVKCRPPGNRVPELDETTACAPYLGEQIRLVDPAVILLVGGTAVKAMTDETRGITKLRGTWRELAGRPCMPVYHPSYLLRNDSRAKGSPKWQMWQDIQAVKARLEAEVVAHPRPAWRVAVQVRLATPGDAPTLCDVNIRSIREVCGPDYPPSVMDGWLANKTPGAFAAWADHPELRLYAGLLEGRIAGVALLRVAGAPAAPGVGVVQLLYVAPEALGTGLGKAMLARLEATARAAGLARLQLKSTLTAREFYVRQGYQDDGLAEGRIPGHAMWKDL